MFREYTASKFAPSKEERAKLTSEQLKTKEAEHAAEQETIRKQREQAVEWLKELNECEHLVMSKSWTFEEKIRESMKRKAEERRQQREERLDAAQQAADEEKNIRKECFSLLTDLKKLLVERMEYDREFLHLLKEFNEYKKKKTQ